jgi:hypothetical protein
MSVFAIGLLCIYFLVSDFSTKDNPKTITISTTTETTINTEENRVQSKSITSDIDINKDLLASAVGGVDELPHPPEPKALQSEKLVLDVPLLKQMDAPRLYNGCEVTSLAMLLQFEGLTVSKNDLANKITRVPLKYQDGIHMWALSEIWRMDLD